jgi:hypothetical protein
MKEFPFFSCPFLRISFISLCTLFINDFIITQFHNVTPCALINTKVSKETALSSYCTLQTELHVPPKRLYLYTSPRVVQNLRWLCLVNVVKKFWGP